MEPYGSRIDKPPIVSQLNSKVFLFLQVSPSETSLIQVLSKRNLKMVLLEKILEGRALFHRKVHSLSVAPEPLTIWNKKLEGLKNSKLKN
jgi:hypothetical protein